jgi:hypothetical protein
VAYGPKPKPTAILNRRGSWRGKARQGEIQPDLDEVALPEELKGFVEATRLWYGLQKKLVNLGMWDSSNARPLARYCLVCDCMVNLAKSGEIMNKSAEFMRYQVMASKLESVFGFTPSDRVGKQGFVGGEDKGKGKKSSIKFFSA